MMKLVPVDSIPKKRRHHKLQAMIEMFVLSESNLMEVIFDETDYKNSKSCRSCIATAA